MFDSFDFEVDCCSSTQIMSPNYPNSYPSNAEETWLLTAPVGLIINLQFHSFHGPKENSPYIMQMTLLCELVVYFDCM